jgi:hypothetical protein
MRITKKSMAVLGALIAAFCTITAAAALAGTPHQAQHALSGTWATKVQISDAPPGVPSAFNALDTFDRGGGLLVSSSAPNPATRSLAHGSWTHTNHRNYTAAFAWFRFDPTGAAVGTQRVQRTMHLSPDGKRFKATDVIEVVAPSGEILATLHATESGTLVTD